MTRAPWLDYLIDHLGEKEIPGPQDNPLIVKWGKDAGIGWWNNDEDAWCAVAVNGALVAAGYPSTRSALARSFLDYGTELAGPVPGAIFVVPRGSNPLYGHTGIVEYDNGDGTLTVVNGNVGNMVKRSVVRKSSVLPGGYRWPPGAPMPVDAGPIERRLGSRLLKIGTRGEDVRTLQEHLSLLGTPLAVDSIFGRDTRSAVIAFQDLNNLDPDGVVGAMTLSALEEAVAAQRNRDRSRKAAASAAKPVAAMASVGSAAGVAVAVDVAHSVKSLNDGTVVGLIAVIAVAAVLGFFGYRYFIQEAADAADDE